MEESAGRMQIPFVWYLRHMGHKIHLMCYNIEVPQGQGGGVCGKNTSREANKSDKLTLTTESQGMKRNLIALIVVA